MKINEVNVVAITAMAERIINIAKENPEANVGIDACFVAIVYIFHATGAPQSDEMIRRALFYWDLGPFRVIS